MKTFIKRMENSDFDKTTGVFAPHIATSRFGYTEIIPQSNRAFTWDIQDPLQEQELLQDIKIHLKQEINDLKIENSKLRSKLILIENKIIEKADETHAYDRLYSYSPNLPHTPQSHCTTAEIDNLKEILSEMMKTKRELEDSNSLEEIKLLKNEVKELKNSVGHVTNEVINTSLELQKARYELKIELQNPKYKLIFEQKERIQQLKQEIRSAIDLHRKLKLRFYNVMNSDNEYSDSEALDGNEQSNLSYVSEDISYLELDHFSSDICAPNEIVVNVQEGETEDDLRCEFDQFGIISDVIIRNGKAIIVFDSEQSAINASCMK